MQTIATFNNWLASNQTRLDLMSVVAKARIVEMFACYVVENHKKFNLNQDVNELKAIIEQVCRHFSQAPQRTINAIIDSFGFGWPSVKGDHLHFKLDYWSINVAYVQAELYSCLESKQLEGKGAAQELQRIQEQKQQEEEKKEAIDRIVYGNKEELYTANKAGLAVTNIMPCVCCGELVPVSYRHTHIKSLANVHCGRCLEDGYTIQKLKKQKAQLNKLTKQLKESIKNENE